MEDVLGSAREPGPECIQWGPSQSHGSVLVTGLSSNSRAVGQTVHKEVPMLKAPPVHHAAATQSEHMSVLKDPVSPDGRIMLKTVSPEGPRRQQPGSCSNETLRGTDREANGTPQTTAWHQLRSYTLQQLRSCCKQVGGHSGGCPSVEHAGLPVTGRAHRGGL